MNKIYFYFLIQLILFVSCQNTNEDNIIPEDKMVNMLLDLSIIKSINNLNYEENKLIISTDNFFILLKHNIYSLKWNVCFSS